MQENPHITSFFTLPLALLQFLCILTRIWYLYYNIIDMLGLKSVILFYLHSHKFSVNTEKFSVNIYFLTPHCDITMLGRFQKGNFLYGECAR